METYKPTYEQVQAALELATDRLLSFNQDSTLDQIDAILAPPPPTYKEVTVEMWAVVAPSGYVEEIYATEEFAQHEIGNTGCFPGYSICKLTGTRRVPVKQPVRKRVSVEGVSISKGDFRFVDGCINPHEDMPLAAHPECHG